MNSGRGIGLKAFSIAFPLAILAFLTVIASALWLVLHSFNQVEQVLESRRVTLELTSEFSRVVEMSSRLVRAFAATGDTRFLTYYYGLAEYRNGKSAKPSDNPIQYWEEVIAGLREYAPAAEIAGKSFPQRMREAGFSIAELAVLDEALTVGEQLEKTEQVAFAATQGLYDPAKGEFVSDGKPNSDFALKLVYGPDYAKLLAKLNLAVSHLAALADARTAQSVQSSTNQLLRAVLIAGTAISILLALALLTSFFIDRYVLKPIQKFAAVSDRIAGGDYQTRLMPSKAVAEITTVASAFNNMASAIEDDIRQRQVVLRELEEARALAESATRAKSMFLANMSHEVRTPMNAIIGMAYLALKTRLDPRQRDYLAKIHDAGKSLLGIINDILDFSKIEANRLDLERIPFDLLQTVANSLFLVRENAMEKEVELLLDIDPALIHEPQLLGDGLRLGQILTNLLSNAVKFTHQGHVQLSIRRVGNGAGSTMVNFAVSDTGIGMNAEQKSRLFQEFTQADGSTTRQYGGTGLGLAISKRLVQLMGGTIEVESEPGRGSRFHFTAEFGKADVAGRILHAGAAGGRVLIVDDLPEARLVLLHMLEDLGLDVVQANNGEMALAALRDGIDRNEPFTMAFIDWVMPGMSGDALIHAIRSRFGTRAPQLLVVSAYYTEALRESVSRLGVRHFLPKPILPIALQQLFETGHEDLAPDPRNALPPGAASAKGMRVLLVEDQPINQQLAIELLLDIGASPELASDGKEALTMLDAHDPDYYSLVLMDLQMPELDGYETTRRIRTQGRYARLPIVAMTAHVTLEEREHCIALGMRGHISKPIDPDELSRLVLGFGSRTVNCVPAPSPMPRATNMMLPRIYGLDTDDGLGRTRQNPELYSHLLAQFAENFRSFAEESGRLIREHKAEDALRLAHSLKGVAASLGARRVADAAAGLERALRCDEHPQTALADVECELSPLLRHLESHFSERMPGVRLQPSAAPPSASTPLPEWVNDLRRLLTDSDVAAQKLWEQRGAELSDVLPVQTYGKLQRALDNFEFDDALEALTLAKAIT